MLAMQKEVYDQTVILDSVPRRERSHVDEAAAARQAGKETEIVAAVDKCLLMLKDDGTSKALPEMIVQAREDMTKIVHLLGQAEVGHGTQATEQEVIKALEEILGVLKQQQRNNNMPPKKSQGPSKDDKKQQPGQQKLIDNLIELKLIRTMQTRVNDRTECCRKLIAGEEAPPEKADLLESLLQLSAQQERIFRITRDLDFGKNQ